MKKYLLALGLVAFFMTSCCDKQEEQATCCDHQNDVECNHPDQRPPMCPEMMANINMMVDALANWDNLEDAQKEEAINVAKEMAAKKAECEHQHEGCQGNHEGCQGNHEGCNHQHEGCNHQHEGCNHEEGHKCEGNHEGCQHNK